jgi:hypothetical protein
MGEISHELKRFTENLEIRNRLADLRENNTTVLELILKKWALRVYIEFIHFRAGSYGVLF